MSEDNGWHLDKKVPISLIVTIVLQTAAIAWFISALNGRVTAVESITTQMQAAAIVSQQNIAQNTTGVAVINQRFDNVEKSLDRIEKKLEKNE